MSQENADLHRGAIAAFNNRDLGALLALMDEDVTASTQTTAMEGRFSGHDGIRRWWGGMFDAFPDWTIEVLDVRDFRDGTVVAIRAHGHGAVSGAPVERFTFQAARWRGGKALQWHTAETEVEALEAVGLSE